MWYSFISIFAIILHHGSASPNEEVCAYQKSVELTNGSYNGIKFEENEYFVESNRTGIERGCVCLKGTCARKCCPPGMMYKNDVKVCINNTVPFDPPVYEGRVRKEGFNASEKFIFIYGKMECETDKGERRYPVVSYANDLRLGTDGNLYVDVENSVPSILIYEPDKYCIDTFVSDGVDSHLDALICFVTKEENNNYKMSSSCMLISCFFILLTVAVYAWVPELRNLHGMVLMAYLLSFFVGFLLLATIQILILREQMTQKICLVTTFIIYYALLAAFFWLNVMCYDIWWTFSGKRAVGSRDRSKKKFHARFMLYASYAFGMPTALTILLAALEFSNIPMHALLPRLRVQGCFLYGNSKLLYLYGPIVLLCVANITFFILTAIKIAKIKKETKMLHTNKDSSTNDKERNERDTQRFGLYVKLFAVMGINWILEVVSSFWPEENFWLVSDAYNVLVGLIIFIIFVCKKKTYNMIRDRFNKKPGDSSMSRTQTTNFNSATRNHTMKSGDVLQLNTIKK